MREQGRSRAGVLSRLRSLLKMDRSFFSGRIIGSMCTVPHPLASSVFSRYIVKNVGDPGLFPSTMELEREVVDRLAALLGLKEKAGGWIVTGGTEANILAMWTARTLHGSRGNEVICPESAHVSFDKAADMLGLRIIRVGLDEKFRMRMDLVRAALSARTIALVAVAGSTGLGAVDPVGELSALAVERDLYLHVDAAFGGFVLPFLAELGYPSPAFDFSLPGVSSITIDPHKMGMATIPSGGIVYRTRELAAAVSHRVPYLAGGETAQATIVGTRSGASVLAVWALLEHLGKRGYREVVRRCMELTCWLKTEIEKLEGYAVMTEPTVNVLGLAHRTMEARELAELLRDRGWSVSLFPGHLRIVVMPHLKKADLKKLVNSLRDP